MDRAERTPRAEWSKRVARWRASGLTASEFASRHGFNVTTLRWWSSRLGRASKASPTSSLSPLTFVEMTGAVLSREPIELALPSGVRVRVPHDFDAGALERLLDVLARPSAR
jgi:hypothetical protein